ncbi:hypothetical protein BIY24_13095 [Halobacteriovorax marinus]|uniref:LPS assembly lipoprotein LptE n=1 Tax=Halobacteriovorax marinus TaxID=97084 RepID=UPI000BC31201|nr:LPS assembly lipoprotein LptE [Halobacteriovorax marinus]ATH08849.1 hypothetical protein BIY24_13095 [Halobacteriovorax marinus]
MKIFTLLALFLLSSCAGYQFRYQNNPFAAYGINSIAIPNFLNKSLVPNASTPFTESISSVLSQNTTLKIHSGNSTRADATLIGIISSLDRKSSFNQTTGRTLIEDRGGRRDFYAPNQTSYKMTLNIILIKKPTQLDLQLINKDFLPYLDKHPKVVFSKVINLSTSYTRFLSLSSGPDGAGVTNATQNREIFNKSVESLASSAGSTFRETVLNAF